MKLLIAFFLLQISSGILASSEEWGGMNESGREMLSRELRFNQDRRLDMYFNFTQGSSPVFEGTGEPIEMNPYGAPGSNLSSSSWCAVSPEKPNPHGVTDQWKCLSKFNQYYNDLWEKKLELFLAENLYLPKDFFEIREKYPEALIARFSAMYLNSIIRQLVLLERVCAQASPHCQELLPSSAELWSIYFIGYYCPATPADLPPKARARVWQPSAGARAECIAFSKDVIKGGFAQALARPPELDQYEVNALKNGLAVYEGDFKVERTKNVYAFLSHYLENPSKDNWDATQHADMPYQKILRRAAARAQKIIRASDPAITFKTEYKDENVKPDYRELAKKNRRELPETVPEVSAKRSFSRVDIAPGRMYLEEGVKVLGDLITPAAAYVKVDVTSVMDRQAGKENFVWERISGIIKAEKPVTYPIAKPFSPPSGESNNTAPIKEVVPVVSEKEPPPSPDILTDGVNRALNDNTDFQTLLSLAEMEAKMEITSEINCAGGSTTRACLFYKAYLEEVIPSKLGAICKSEACQKGYKELQAAVKFMMAQKLGPVVATSAPMNGAFVDPLKLADVRDRLMTEKKAFDLVMLPVLSRSAPPSKRGSIAWEPDSKLISDELCRPDQQLDTGGNLESCQSYAAALTPTLKQLTLRGKQNGGEITRAFTTIRERSLALDKVIQENPPASAPAKAEETKPETVSDIRISAPVSVKESGTSFGQGSLSGSETSTAAQKKRKRLSPEEIRLEAQRALKNLE